MSAPPQRPPPPILRSQSQDKSQVNGEIERRINKTRRPLSTDETRLTRITRSASPDYVTSNLDDPKLRRRSYTMGYSSRHRPPPPRRQLSATTDFLPEKPQRPAMLNRVPKAATPEPNIEKKAISSPPHRPSRPPPPRAKSLPKSASLSTYKKRRDNNEIRRPHSATAENVHAVNSTSHRGSERRPPPPRPGVTSPPPTHEQETTGVDNHDEAPPPKPARAKRNTIKSQRKDSMEEKPPSSEQPSVSDSHEANTGANETESVDNHLDVEFTLTPQSVLPPVPPRPERPARPYPPGSRPPSNRSTKRSSTRPNGSSPKQRSRPRDPSKRSARRPRPPQAEKQNVRTELNEQQVPTAEQPENVGNVENSGDTATVTAHHDEDRDNVQPEENTTVQSETSIPDIQVQDSNSHDHQSPTNEDQEDESATASASSPNGRTLTSPSHNVSTNSDRPAMGRSKTVFVRTEEEDTVAPLPSSSSPSRGRKTLFSSMKSSMRIKNLKFHSLRKPKEKQFETRRATDTSLLDPEAMKMYPDPLPHGILNPLVVQCVAYLNRETVLEEVGLFRVPGDVAVIKKLRERFLKSEDVDLMEILDPHTVTGLLKLHFREQRVSMIPRGRPLQSVNAAVKERDVDSVREIFDTIDPLHIATLKVVCEMLYRVSSHSDKNQMTPGILATSCGPSMFPYLPPSSANGVLKFMIDHCQELFTV